MSKIKIELNERDYRVLATLYLLRVGSNKQLGTLHFSSSNACYKRLLQLRGSGYVSVTTLGNPHSKRWIHIYQLTLTGAREAKRWLNIHYKRKFPTILSKKLLNKRLYEHELLMVDVFVELVKENLLTVDDLLDGTFLDSRLSPVLSNIYNERGTLKPDARFRINHVNYWLEIDRGTESIGLIEQKIKRYQSYFSINSEEQHIVLFLIAGKIDSSRLNDVKTLSCQYLGELGIGGMTNWYTLPFTDLEFIVKNLIRPNYFGNCIDGLNKPLEKFSIEFVLYEFENAFLPTTNMPRAWLGYRNVESNYEQFYVVENLVGGESGALHRLRYFEFQKDEYRAKRGGNELKLIIIIQDTKDLMVIAELYPKLFNELIYVFVHELLSGQYSGIITREGEKDE